MTGPVLSVRGLEVAFGGGDNPVPVVRGIDFDVYANEVLCIVGESGSGKSVTALAISGLLPATARVRGSIVLGGTEVIGADPESLRNMRGEEVGFIFQDPTTTLNPVLPVGRQVTEGQVAHGRLPASDAPERAVALLREVDIADPVGRAQAISAPILRRDEAARGHCDGDGRTTQTHSRGRTHDGARRHRAGASACRCSRGARLKRARR